MGLGKTVQSIAAISAYSHEWPVLILSPSSARFNWEKECILWLGNEENGNKRKNPRSNKLLTKNQIQVLESGKDEIDENAKIVVCSYNSIASFIDQAKIKEGSFQCNS